MIRVLGLLAAILAAAAPAAAQPSDAKRSAPVQPGMSVLLQDALLFASTKGQGRLIEPKIFGGQKAAAGADPWQVGVIPRVLDNVMAYCGGALIAPTWVVTAAHCVDNGTSPLAIQVYAGSINQDTGGRRVNVRNIHIRPDYAPDPLHRNDIALLELETPQPQADVVALLSLAQQAEGLRKNAAARVTGWGLVAPDAAGGVRELRAVELKVRTNAACNDPTLYDGRITAEMVCAGSLETPGDACEGDSGGPLSVQLGETRVLGGVVSWGRRCGQLGRPGVYTRVALFTGWIAACQAGAPVCANPPPVAAPLEPGASAATATPLEGH